MRILFSTIAIILSFSALGQNARLVVPIGHTSDIQETIVSNDPKAKFVATGGLDKKAIVWDRLSGKEIVSIGPLEGDVTSIAFSPDNKFLLIGGSEMEISLWSLEGQLVRQFSWDFSYPSGLDFSSDGSSFLAIDYHGAIKFYNTNQKDPVWEYNGLQNIRSARFVDGPSGEAVLAGGIVSEANPDAGSSRGAREFFTYPACSFINVKDGSQQLGLRINQQGHYVAARLSPDGSKVLLESSEAIWMVNRSNKVLWSKEEPHIYSCFFSVDGKNVIMHSDRKLLVLDANSGRESRASMTVTPNARSLMYLPSLGEQLEKQMIYFTDDRVNFGFKSYDLNGNVIADYNNHSTEVERFEFSEDGQSIFLDCGPSGRKEWQLKANKVIPAGNSAIRQLPKAFDSLFIRAGAFPPQHSNQFLYDDGESRIQLVDINTGGVIREFEIPEEPGDEPSDGEELGLQVEITLTQSDFDRWVTGIFCSQAEQIFGVAQMGGRVHLWSLDDNAGPLMELAGHEGHITEMAFSKNKKYILGGSNSKGVYLWNRSGELIQSYTGHTGRISFCGFSKDEKMVFTSGEDNTIRAWDLLSGKLIKKFDGHDAWGVMISPDRKLLASFGMDNQTKLWKWDSGEELGALVLLDKASEWAFVAKNGLCDATRGAFDLMHYVIGEDIVDLRQFEDRYYQPGLVPILTGMVEGSISKVPPLTGSALPPRVQSQINGETLEVQLSDQGGGIGRTSFFINGSEKEFDINPQKKTRFTIDLQKYERFYSAKGNELGVLVYNKDGSVKGKMDLHNYIPAVLGRGENNNDNSGASNSNYKPHLYAIVIGTAKYSGENMSLNFPDKDSEAFQNAIKQAGEGVFPGRTHIQLLNTSGSGGVQVSSKSNVKKAFEEVASKAKPDDVLLVYFSGHGVAYGNAEKTQFYYLTKDALSFDLRQEDIRNARTISSEDLVKWHSDIPAKKQLLIIDACNSGKLAEAFDGIRDKNIHFSEVKAIRTLNGRTGMYILAGSAADRASYEATAFGQGLLTYSLLEGMNGGGLKERYVDVPTWFGHAQTQVKSLASGLNRVQEPVIDIPIRSQAFPIGYMKPGSSIKVPAPKPVFKRSNFQDSNFGDELNLIYKLTEKFEELKLQGAQAPIMYYDVPDYESETVYSIRGRYTVTGDDISLEAKLFKGNKPFGNGFKVNGNKNNMSSIIDDILFEVMEILN